MIYYQLFSYFLCFLKFSWIFSWWVIGKKKVIAFKVVLNGFSHFELVLREVIVVCVGLGTDEKEVILILGHRNASQRKKIRETYQQLYNESLIDRLYSELSGDFRVCLFLSCCSGFVNKILIKKLNIIM